MKEKLVLTFDDGRTVENEVDIAADVAFDQRLLDHMGKSPDDWDPATPGGIERGIASLMDFFRSEGAI
jgi:hypothetical protein